MRERESERERERESCSRIPDLLKYDDAPFPGIHEPGKTLLATTHSQCHLSGSDSDYEIRVVEPCLL